MRSGQEDEESTDFVMVCALHGPAGAGPIRSVLVSEKDRAALVLCDEPCFLRLREQIAKAREGGQQPALTDESSADGGTGGDADAPGAGLSLPSAQHSYDVLLRCGHEGRVVSLASAVSKPLMVSCATDQTLRVWDLRRLTCQFVAPLNEVPLSLTVHPDGMHIAIAFESCLSLSHIGLDGLLPWRDLPLPSARVIAFSHGGHLLAASQGNYIVVYESYALTMVASLVAHLAPVTSLAWAADDTAFTSGGADGMFYSWSAQTFKRVHECRMYKGAGVAQVAVLSESRPQLDAADAAFGGRPASTSFRRPAAAHGDPTKGGGAAAAAAAEAEHTVLVVGGAADGHDHSNGGSRHERGGGGGRDSARETSGDKDGVAPINPASVLRLVERTDEHGELTLGSDPLCCVVALPGARLAFCGSSSGAVFTVACSMHGDFEKLTQKGGPLRPHLASASVLLASHDERLLFSGGADGSIFIFERTEGLQAGLQPFGADAAGGGAAKVTLSLGATPGGAAEAAASYSEVQCVSRESLDRAGQELATALSQYSHLQAAVATERERSEVKVQATLAKQTKEFSEAQAEAEKRQRQAAAAQNAEIAALHKRFAEFASRSEEGARSRQSHLEMCLRREISTHEEVSAELAAVREHAALELAKLSVSIREASEAKEAMETTASQMIEEVKAGYEADLTTIELHTEARQLQLVDEYDATLLLERTEAGQNKEQLETEIKSLQMQQYMMRKKLELHVKEKEAREGDIRKKEAKAEEAAREMAELKAAIDKLRGEAVSRERELSDRDKNIVAMHSSTQRLESTKQLLELRVKELEDVHEPMMVQLYDLKMTSSRLEAELLAEGETRKNAETEVATLKETQKRLEGKLKKAEVRAGDAEASHMVTLAKMFQMIEAHTGMATLMEYVRNRDKELTKEQERNGRPRKEKPPPDDEDMAVLREITRQRDKMQGTVDQLAHELRRTKDKSRESKMHLGLETQRMNEELNDQRRKNHKLTQELAEAAKTISLYTGAGGRSRTKPLLMPPPADEMGMLAAGQPGAGGLTHSATVGDLRSQSAPLGTAKGGVPRPDTAPGFAAPPPAAAPAASKRDQHEEMSEVMERHMLENQRLREQLLHFTGKPSDGRRRKNAKSLGMPLPPV